MNTFFIIGCSAHGRVVLDILRASKNTVVAGWVDDAVGALGNKIEGLPVLGKIADLPELQSRLGPFGVIIAVGDNAIRAHCVRRVLGFVPPITLGTAVHASAVVALGCVLGSGTIVAAGAIVNPGARVGVGCIVNTRASLDHDVIMEDYSSVAPGVVVGGEASIGKGSAIGIGAVVANRIRIGRNTVVGAGAVVVRHLPDNVVAFGNPARVIRQRQDDEPYLTAHMKAAAKVEGSEIRRES